MIDEIKADNVALIREATLEFSPKLTVLTGETGTGKSALLSSLKLLIGDRANTSSIREGSSELEVEGRFFLGDKEEDGHIVRRRLSQDGHGRVEIDGHLATVHELADTLGASVDLCGQHEHQRLMDTSTHAELLDAYAGEATLSALEHYRSAFKEAQAAHRALKRIQKARADSQENAEQAAFVLNQIEQVEPSQEDYEELQEELPRAEHAEMLMSAADAAHRAVTEDGGVSDILSGVIQQLQDAARYDEKLKTYADNLESSLIEAEDAASELRDYRDSVELDPEELQQLEERNSQYQGLLRSYGPDLEHVLKRRDEAEELVSVIQDGDEREREAQKKIAEAENKLKAAAAALQKLRHAAAPKLTKAITAVMGQLEMDGAAVTFSIEDLPREEWAQEGPSAIELMYRPGAGLSLRPLRRIASGGELSRVMLASKVVLGNADAIDTLVFDEVDAGVGGATAVALAQVLAQLAQTHQVIVVTHLAQVAVVADTQYVVDKTEGDVPETKIHKVEGEKRVREIARMLSGDQSEASLNHAREMLEHAHVNN